MNLPVINQLNGDRSTYITFSKANLDHDASDIKGTPYYMTRMVAIELPDWDYANFDIDLSSVGVVSTNPNVKFSKAIQYYMENITRQAIGLGQVTVEEVTELAFWKMLEKMGMDQSSRESCVKVVNRVATSNFVSSENNNGWGEVVAQVPNMCQLLTPAWRTVANIDDIVQCTDADTALYDNGNKEFLFGAGNARVLDFGNMILEDTVQQEIRFNCILMFYTDGSGVEKLHGINFMYPYESHLTYWSLPTFTQVTNESNTIGYQFKFFVKTCNNQASQLVVEQLEQHTHWDTFMETLSKLNSFLELKMKETN
jgi:hypothetical protein